MIDETPMKYILIVQCDWNAKVGEDARKDWKGTCGLYSNAQTNERGFLLLEFASHNDLFLTNTFGPYKPSRRWTWHSPNGQTHNQIDYIMVKKRFRSSVNIRSCIASCNGDRHSAAARLRGSRRRPTYSPVGCSRNGNFRAVHAEIILEASSGGAAKSVTAWHCLGHLPTDVYQGAHT